MLILPQSHMRPTKKCVDAATMVAQGAVGPEPDAPRPQSEPKRTQHGANMEQILSKNISNCDQHNCKNNVCTLKRRTLHTLTRFKMAIETLTMKLVTVRRCDNATL